MLQVQVLDKLHPHSSNVAHGVEVPAGARLLFTNGQVGTLPDGTTPEDASNQVTIIFERLKAVLAAARMSLDDVVRFDVFVTDESYVKIFVAARDAVMGRHKPAATLLVVKGLARPALKIEVEAIAAKVD